MEISLLIPTILEANYMELLYRSFIKNSTFKNHQFIVHINGDIPSTEKFCIDNNIEYTKSAENKGIPYGYNVSMDLIRKQYIMLMNDDMYMLPDWDGAIDRSMSGGKYDWRSSMIMYNYGGEVPWAFKGCRYGGGPKDFNEKKLLAEYKKYIEKRIIIHQRPPMVIRTEVWKELKGWDEYFERGPGGDPDFAYRFWQACGKDSTQMQSVPDSLIYHFGSVGYRTRQGKPNYNKGHELFFKKWGIPIRRGKGPHGYSGNHFRGLIEAGKVLKQWK